MSTRRFVFFFLGLVIRRQRLVLFECVQWMRTVVERAAGIQMHACFGALPGTLVGTTAPVLCMAARFLVLQRINIDLNS